MKIYADIEQGTDEWKKLRQGKFTASNFATLFMKKTTAGYNDLINKVVFERLTGESPEEFSNKWTDRGTELEPLALIAYSEKTFNLVERVAFVELDEWTGCSPDGLVGSVGMVQAKCPKYSTLMDYLISDTIPKDYAIQMQGEMMCSGREWNDFWVWHPQFKPMLKRLERSETVIKSIKEELEIAIGEALNRIEKLNGKH